MKLIVGLGNPGDNYSLTKHNFGFWVIDRLVKQSSLKYKAGKGDYVYAKSKKYMFVKPTTYVNNSGIAINQILNYYDILKSDDIIVVYDDIDFDLGTIKFKSQGSDGGGSIRIPASFSGVYGYKPSYGRVPFITRPNAFTSLNPFLFVGPITRTVEDAALLMSVIGKHDPRDPFSMPSGDVNYLQATRKPVSGMKVAYSPDLGIFPVEESVAKVVHKATEAFKELGIEVDQVEIKIDRSQQELSDLWVRQMAMLHMELAEMFKPQGIDLLGEHNSMLTPTFAKTLEIGKKMSGWDVRSGELLRSSVYDPIQDILDDYDFIVSPTLSVPPFKNATNGDTLGPTEVNGETVDPTIGWCMTYPINYTGNPAASIPAGLTAEGLPIGMQIIGRRHADEDLLAISAAFERARPWFQSYIDLEEKHNGN